MLKRILVIGDSYASAGRNQNLFSKSTSQTFWSTNEPVWTNLLQDHYECGMTIFGYGGQSWWFSYQMFEDWKELSPDQWKETDTVIFLHTHWLRFNSRNRLVPGNLSRVDCDPSEEKELETNIDALKKYETFLMDKKFHMWCQNRFFSTLSDVFQEKKIINLSCFPQIIKHTDFLKISAGTVVTPDLGTISFGEFIRRPNGPFYDDRMAHLSLENHKILADHLIRFVDDYQLGIREIPVESFRQGFLNPPS